MEEIKPICRAIEIGGERYFEHQVFGLVKPDFFTKRGILPTAPGYPVVVSRNSNGYECFKLDPKFKEADDREKYGTMQIVQDAEQIFGKG